MENLITFVNYSNQIPIILGMLGKENLEYQSIFDQNNFENSNIQTYFSRKLNAKIMFFKENHPDYKGEDFLNDDFAQTASGRDHWDEWDDNTVHAEGDF